MTFLKKWGAVITLIIVILLLTALVYDVSKAKPVEIKRIMIDLPAYEVQPLRMQGYL